MCDKRINYGDSVFNNTFNHDNTGFKLLSHMLNVGFPIKFIIYYNAQLNLTLSTFFSFLLPSFRTFSRTLAHVSLSVMFNPVFNPV